MEGKELAKKLRGAMGADWIRKNKAVIKPWLVAKGYTAEKAKEDTTSSLGGNILSAPMRIGHIPLAGFGELMFGGGPFGQGPGRDMLTKEHFADRPFAERYERMFTGKDHITDEDLIREIYGE